MSVLREKITKVFKKDFLRSLIANLMLQKRLIMVHIGTYGISINVFKNKKLLATKFLPSGEEMGQDAKDFILNYKNSKVAIIADTEEATLHAASIPVAQGFMTEKSVMEYISKTFDKNDLVSYNVHAVADGENQVLHVCFSSLTPNKLVSEWVEFCAVNCSNLQGVYFNSLLVPGMIDHLVTQEQKEQYPLRIMVTVSGSSGVRIVVTHGENVMVSRVAEYPADKSNEYIQGVIEQEVVDRLIGLKDYLYHKQIKPLVVLFVTPELEELLKDSTFEASEHLIADKLIIPSNNFPAADENHLMDKAISSVAAGRLDKVATSLEFRNFFRVNKINNFYLKPIWLLLTVMFVLLGYNYIKSYRASSAAELVNNKYYTASERYRDIKKQYPDIDDIEQLISYKVAEDEINGTQFLPFEFINNLIDKLPENIKVTRMVWGLYGGDVNFLDIQNGAVSSNRLESEKWYKKDDLERAISPRLQLQAQYITNQSNEDNILKSVRNDLAYAQKMQQGYVFTIEKDTSDNMRGSGDKLYFPIKLTITKE